MADNKRRGFGRSSSDDANQSIFDLFEPPPEEEVSSFGKIPVVRDDDGLDLTESEFVEAQAAAEAEAAGLAHWTEPATGEIPASLAADLRGRTSDVKGPSWRGEEPNWAGAELSDVFADTDAIRHDRLLADDGDHVSIDPNPTTPPPPGAAAPRRRSEGRSVFDRGAPAAQTGGLPVPEPERIARQAAATEAPASRPAPVPRTRRRPLDDGIDAAATAAPTDPRVAPAAPAPVQGNGHDTPPRPSSVADGIDGRARRGAHDFSAGMPDREAAPRIARAMTNRVPEPQRPGRAAADRGADSADVGRTRPSAADDGPGGVLQATTDELGGAVPGPERVSQQHYDDAELDDALGYRSDGRSLSQSVIVGVAMAAIVFTALLFGPEPTIVLVGILTLLSVLELFSAMRSAGLRPATLLGLVGAVALPAATYLRGDAGYPLVIGLAVVFGMLWYLIGADTERPVLNLGLTLTGVAWIGGLAGFAALMLRADGGTGLLLATIIITAASDTLAYFGGRAYGTKPFHSASPNKTWEGTVTGFFGAIFAGLTIGAINFIDVFDDQFTSVMVLALVVGILAPIGDLAESLVKRDLGVKDMGSILPGHGGVLDRVDGLLFALPGAYYVAIVYGLIP